jgi:hypothetical protein
VNRLQRQALKSKSQILSAQIFSFLNHQWLKEPRRRTVLQSELWRKRDFESFHKISLEDVELKRKYESEMSDRFDQQFAPGASALRAELAIIGLTSPELNKLLEDRLRLSGGIRSVAEELQKLSNKIEE